MVEKLPMLFLDSHNSRLDLRVLSFWRASAFSIPTIGKNHVQALVKVELTNRKL